MDNNDTTTFTTTTIIVSNWISYNGIGWPLVIAVTGLLTKYVFQQFNHELVISLNNM